jgi:hypothetical protein
MKLARIRLHRRRLFSIYLNHDYSELVGKVVHMKKNDGRYDQESTNISTQCGTKHAIIQKKFNYYS